VIILYYRWWRSLPILLAPLLLAATYAFAIVTLPPFRVDSLNSNTAFLGSIIVGNGINFGIVLLARYTEERRKGVAVHEALVTAIWGTRAGTLAASMAAGASYTALVFTQFRGFRQFGIIGGVGMLVCWGAAFVLTPSLVSALDRDEKTAPGPGSTSNGVMARVAQFVARYPAPVVIIGFVFTAAAGFELRKMNRSRLEYDFSKLRRADTFVLGEGYWGKKMDDLLGRYLSPTVYLCDDTAQCGRLANDLRSRIQKPPLVERIASMTTVEDVLPSDQKEKIEIVEQIREMLTPKVREGIDAEKLKSLDAVLGDEKLKPVTTNDLPATFTTGLRERDGSMDKSVLVYPRPTRSLWQGESLIEFTRQLRAVADEGTRPGESKPRLAGALPLSSDIIQNIERDGTRATAAALVGVIVVVLLILRRSSSTLYVIGSLCVGVLWLAALTIVLDVKLNFCNFIAFPITFGIGVDYSVNIMARYAQDGARDVTSAIKSTGGAVGLASLTTIIGYSSLLVAENRALFSFGLVAVLGEVACLATAVVFLPAVLLLRKPKSTS
jgi:predicted RND superfamily exporter protein